MPGPLNHSPADVLRWALVQHGTVTDPTPATLQAWPCYASAEPDAPDDCATVYDTDGVGHGRDHVTGERQEHHGAQVRVRSATHAAGYAKASAVAAALDTGLYRESVTVGGSNYLLHAATRTTGVISLGADVPGSRRFIFTVNAILAVRMLA